MYRKAPGKAGIVTVLGGNRYLVPFIRGIATPVCELARNDSIYSTNTNLPFCSMTLYREKYTAIPGKKQPETLKMESNRDRLSILI